MKLDSKKYPTIAKLVLAESNPSQYQTPEKLSEAEMFAAIRQDLIAELDAINLYTAHKEATDNQELIKILDHIIEEEKDHAKMLQEFLEKSGKWVPDKSKT